MKPSDLSKVLAQLPLSKSTLERNAPNEGEERDSFTKAESAPSPSLIIPFRPMEPGEDRLNKTERRYLAYVRSVNRTEWIGIQNLTFRMADDCRYTPDFMVWDSNGLSAIDVKAKWKSTGEVHVEDDALVKIKVCSGMFRWCRFLLAWEENGFWCHKQIKP